MHTPATSSSSTSRRGLEEIRGKHGVLHFALSIRFLSCGLGGVLVRTCQRRGPKTGPPDKISSKTSSLVSVAGFPGTVPVTVPGWFLLLLSPVPVTTF